MSAAPPRGRPSSRSPSAPTRTSSRAAGGTRTRASISCAAIVEQHTIVVDDYVHNTGDIAMRDGHHYCDKAPGMSILAVPVYAAVHPFAGGQRPRGRLVNLGAYLSTRGRSACPAAAAVAIALRARGDARGARPPPPRRWPLAYALRHARASLLHAVLRPPARGRGPARGVRPAGDAPPAGRCRSPRRGCFAAGVLAGGGVAIEYPGALGLVARRPLRRDRRAPVAAAPVARGRGGGPGLALAAYHTAAWGGPLPPARPFLQRSSAAARGVHGHHAGRAWRSRARSCSRETRGLFRHAPWLLLWLPGRGRPRAAAPLPPPRPSACALVPAPVPVVQQLAHHDADRLAGGLGHRPPPPRGHAALLRPRRGGALRHRGRRDRDAAPAAVGAVRRARRLVGGAHAGRHRRPPRGPDLVRPPVRRVPVPVVPARASWRVNTIPIHTGFVHEQRQAWNLGEKLGLSGLATPDPRSPCTSPRRGRGWCRGAASGRGGRPRRSGRRRRASATSRNVRERSKAAASGRKPCDAAEGMIT